MHVESEVISDIFDKFIEISDNFLEVAFLFRLYKVELFRFFLLNHFPFQYSIGVEISVGTAMSVEKEGIGGLHALELKISVFHPEPIL